LVGAFARPPLVPELGGGRTVAGPGAVGLDRRHRHAADVDPARGIVSVLRTQPATAGPDDGFGAFWTAVTRGDV
jgi:hypothetical protein